MNNAWKYSGCSAHSVPSLSKTAMRSGTETKSGEPALITFSTKATIAFLEGPSFHEGSASCPKHVEARLITPKQTLAKAPMELCDGTDGVDRLRHANATRIAIVINS